MLSDTKAVLAGDGFDINPLMSSGLTLFVAGGKYVHPSAGIKAAPSVKLTLTASATNYVEMDDSGAITANATAFTSGQTALYVVSTGASEVTEIADVRAAGGLVGRLDGAQVANLAAANVVGALPVVHMFTLAAGANADNDITLTHKTRVVDAWVVLRGAGVANSVMTIKNTGDAISDAMATSGSDKDIIRAAALDDAKWEIAAGGKLRATSSGGATQPACTVFVVGVRVA